MVYLLQNRHILFYLYKFYVVKWRNVSILGEQGWCNVVWVRISDPASYRPLASVHRSPTRSQDSTYSSGPAVKTLLLRTVVPSVSSADVPVTVILPKGLSMTLVTRTCNKTHIDEQINGMVHKKKIRLLSRTKFVLQEPRKNEFISPHRPWPFSCHRKQLASHTAGTLLAHGTETRQGNQILSLPLHSTSENFNNSVKNKIKFAPQHKLLKIG